MESVEEIVNNQFDMLEKSAVKMCEDFDTNQLPLITIRQLIDNGKVKRIRSKRLYSKHFKAYNNTLDVLMKTCIQSAKSMDKSYIPISFFCKFIEIIKAGVVKGAKG